MTKPIEVQDQRGIEWLVFEGDPAWELVKPFKHLSLIVLPRESILTGELVDVEEPSFPNIIPEMLTEGLKQVIIRQVRMYDVVEHLKERYGERQPVK